MQMDDLDDLALRSRTQQCAEVFVTHDVSNDPDVRRRHGATAEDPSFHSMVGRWLSREALTLGIAKTGRQTPRGMTWQRRSA